MPNPLRLKLLSKIFKEGVESVDPKVLEDLFSRSKKMYHYSENPQQLMKEGFRQQRNKYGDIPGLYWGPNRRELPMWLDKDKLPTDRNEYNERIIEGIVNPLIQPKGVDPMWYQGDYIPRGELLQRDQFDLTNKSFLQNSFNVSRTLC